MIGLLTHASALGRGCGPAKDWEHAYDANSVGALLFGRGFQSRSRPHNDLLHQSGQPVQCVTLFRKIA
jgi:hypothetical protein